MCFSKIPQDLFIMSFYVLQNPHKNLLCIDLNNGTRIADLCVIYPLIIYPKHFISGYQFLFAPDRSSPSPIFHLVVKSLFNHHQFYSKVVRQEPQQGQSLTLSSVPSLKSLTMSTRIPPKKQTRLGQVCHIALKADLRSQANGCSKSQ